MVDYNTVLCDCGRTNPTKEFKFFFKKWICAYIFAFCSKTKLGLLSPKIWRKICILLRISIIVNYFKYFCLQKNQKSAKNPLLNITTVVEKRKCDSSWNQICLVKTCTVLNKQARVDFIGIVFAHCPQRVHCKNSHIYNF